MDENTIRITSHCNMKKLAFKIADRYVKIQECEEGWDYAIYDTTLEELDSGVYADPKTPIKEVAQIICMELSNGGRHGYSPAVCRHIRIKGLDSIPNPIPWKIKSMPENRTDLWQKFYAFIDMDGVLAQWPCPDSIPEAIKKPGFFQNLQSDASALNLLKILQNHGMSTRIISTVPGSNAVQEKQAWLNKYVKQTAAPLFCPKSTSKAEMAKEVINQYGSFALLIDDWNVNLKKWDNAGGTAIKYLNGRNTQDSWHGRCLNQKHIHIDAVLNMLHQIVNEMA